MNQNQTLITQIQQSFNQSIDFIAHPIQWKKNETVILCYYNSLVKKTDIERFLLTYRRLDNGGALPPETINIQTEPFNLENISTYVCGGETVLIRLQTNEIIRMALPNFEHRPPDKPANENIVRGSQEGFVEDFHTNLAIIRKYMRDSQLVVKSIKVGQKGDTFVYYLYRQDIVEQETLQLIEWKLNEIDVPIFYNIGQLTDVLEDSIWSPFPQILATERTDRVISNLAEGKVVFFTDLAPTALITPVTFFSFYESPDDFSNRVIVGSFYKLLRFFSFFIALLLPSFYISIVSFHFEVLPLELSNKVKEDVTDIPYRPFIEAIMLEVIIELIREASIRLPTAVSQTIGIVGGLVIGDAIINAGLVSNLMVIVVAFTAIASFVVPSVEMNTTIRFLRFPFMIIASLFGFLGIVIGIFVLAIHLLNLTSCKKPYFEPIIPLNPKKMLNTFLRVPNVKPKKQSDTFSKKG